MFRKIGFFTTTLLIISALLSGCVNRQNNEKQIKDKETQEMVQHLNKADFLTKIANYEQQPNEWKFLGDKPAIVDFYASWCGPCKALAPILEELAAEYQGQIDIYKVDTEQEMELSSAFGIRSIPSILFIPMQGHPQMAQGALPKMKFKEIINDFLLKK